MVTSARLCAVITNYFAIRSPSRFGIRGKKIMVNLVSVRKLVTNKTLAG